MAVSVQMPNRREEKDPLDTIMKGLSIASSIYGIKDASDKTALLKQKQAADLANEKTLSDKELLQYGSNYNFSDKPQEGSLSFKRKNVDGSLVDIYAIPKPKVEDPLLAAIRGQTFAKNASDMKEKAQGKQLPASEAVSLGGANSSFKALEEAKNTFSKNEDISGPFQGMVSDLAAKGEAGSVGKRAKTFNAQVNANAQIIGKYLEGGKLTDADIERYRSMLPNSRDSAASANEKAVILQNLIAQKQQSEKEALGQAGFNVGKISTPDLQANPNIREGLKSNVSAQDMAAKALARKQGLRSGIKGK